MFNASLHPDTEDAIALYDYEAKENDELSYKKGDKLKLSEK